MDEEMRITSDEVGSAVDAPEIDDHEDEFGPEEEELEEVEFDATLESERAKHLLGAFGTRTTEGQQGIWVPLLDEDGSPVGDCEMYISRSDCDEFQELMGKLSREYGGKRGQVKSEVLRWSFPRMYAKCLWTRMRGDWRLGPEGTVVDEIRDVSVLVMSRRKKRVSRVTKTLKFSVHQDGRLKDTEDNRVKLMSAILSVQSQVWDASSDHSRFPKGEADLAGNS